MLRKGGDVIALVTAEFPARTITLAGDRLAPHGLNIMALVAEGLRPRRAPR